MQSLLLVTILILASVAAAFAEETGAPKPQPVTLIKAARLIDTAVGVVRENQAVLIEDEKIKAIGPAADISKGIPPETRVIDLGNATIVPGLIDCHTHITSQPKNYYEDIFRRSPIDYAVNAHVYARRTLEAGFTTVRDVGAGEFIDIALRNAVNAGTVPGPRILCAGLALGSTGGHADLNGFSPYLSFREVSPSVADGVDAIRKAVRTNIKYGADWIKILASAGVLSEEESVGAPQYTPEEMKAAVDEAALWGRKVAAHAHGAEAIKLAVRAGVASSSTGA